MGILQKSRIFRTEGPPTILLGRDVDLFILLISGNRQCKQATKEMQIKMKHACFGKN